MGVVSHWLASACWLLPAAGADEQRNRSTRTTRRTTCRFGKSISIPPMVKSTARRTTDGRRDSRTRARRNDISVVFARGFLVQGDFARDDAVRLAEIAVVRQRHRANGGRHCRPRHLEPAARRTRACLVNVLPKPGVMDPVAASTVGAAKDAGIDVHAVRTMRKYWLSDVDDVDARCDLPPRTYPTIRSSKSSIGPLEMDQLDVGSPYEFQLLTVPIRELDDDEPGKAFARRPAVFDAGGNADDSRSLRVDWPRSHRHRIGVGRANLVGTLQPQNVGRPHSLSRHRRRRNARKPTSDSTKTCSRRRSLRPRKRSANRWATTIGVSAFSRTTPAWSRLTIRFHACFKVETHNHPSALEPYGGANTGIGGVIRDPMGTGMGAKPVCNTDVFCFAPPDTPVDSLPPGVLHPRRVMKGVVVGRPRLRQSDGHPDGQRCGLF